MSWSLPSHGEGNCGGEREGRETAAPSVGVAGGCDASRFGGQLVGGIVNGEAARVKFSQPVVSIRRREPSIASGLLRCVSRLQKWCFGVLLFS